MAAPLGAAIFCFACRLAPEQVRCGAHRPQPIAIRLALPPAAVVLIEVDTSSSSQLRQ